MAGMPSLPGPPERISDKSTVQRVKSVSDHPLLNRLPISQLLGARNWLCAKLSLINGWPKLESSIAPKANKPI